MGAASARMKPPLQIGMNLAGRFSGGGAFGNRPGPALPGAEGVETEQPEHLVDRPDHRGGGALPQTQAFTQLLPLGGVEANQLLLEQG